MIPLLVGCLLWGLGYSPQSAGTSSGFGSDQLEVHRLAARNRELELQMMVHKMTQTTLRFTEAEGARWCAPSVWFAPAVKRRAGECQSLGQACACTHMPIRPPNVMRN